MTPSLLSLGQSSSRRGIALISVLAMVMLLTALVVAFMLRAGSEKQSSGYYRAEATTRDLSDTTLNLVEGEINEATTQGTGYAWISQPGAIRVFDNTGNPAKSFKLYSASSMIAATTSLTTGANSVSSFFSPDIPSSSWYKAPGIWVDLNAPVNIDTNPNSSGLGSPSYTHFPILDPRDPTTSTKIIAMDGFNLPPTTSPATTVPVDTTVIDSNNKPNPAPMPVQWLYVLQNGSLTAATSGPDASGNYTLAISPTAANPIVGRIAFWTDDETCKVNINTAGADGVMGTTASKDRADPSAIANGTFWSPPYFAAPDDAAPSLDTSNSAWGSGPFGAGYCTALPSQGEYQRYPGHPATVALSNILNTLRPSTTTPYINTTTFYAQSTSTGAAGNTFAQGDVNNNTYTSAVTGAGITPRYVYGGSQENTVNTFGTGTYQANYNLTYGSIATSAYRLYPTLSEALFTPNRGTVTSLNTGDITSRQRMETGRFFLTAHSRAPELNLFGLPRVSIWPMSYTPSWRTPTDNLIAFCTTIGGTQGNTTNGSAYYFTRAASYDSTVDIGLKDSSGNYRNAYLLSYLDYLTKQNIPGFGGNFNAKDYGGGLTGQNDQILTEIFDYVRATNIQDATSPSPYGLGEWQGSNWGVGQVAPSLITSGNSGGVLSWNTQGFASFPRLIEATLQFVAMGRGGVPANAYGPGIPPTNINAIPINPSVVSYAFPSPSLPTTTGVNYPYPPALPPNPSTLAGAVAFNAFASQNPLGYLLGYPQTPQIAQGDTPTPPSRQNVLTYAYVPLLPGHTVPNWTLDNPYAPPGTVDPPVSSYPNPTTIASAPPVTGPYNTIYRVHNYATGLDSGIPPDGTNAVQCFLLFTFINPAQDWIYCSPYVWTSVSGLSNFTLEGQNLGFTDPDCMVFGSGQDWHGGGRSGYTPIDINFQAKGLIRTPGQVNTNPTNGNPFFSKIIPVTSDNTTGSTMSFGGGTVTIKLYDAANGGSWPPPVPDNNGGPVGGHVVQTYTLNFPSTPAMTVPSLPPNPTPVAPDLATYSSNPDYYYPPNSALPLASYQLPQQGTGVPFLPWVTPYIAYNNPSTKFTVWSQTPGPVTCFEKTGPIIGLGEPGGSTPYDYIISCYTRWGQYGATIGVANENLIGTGDVLESMVLSQTWSNDPRMLSISNVPASAFVPHPNWGQQFAHNIWWGMVLPSVGNGSWLNQPWETFYTAGAFWPNKSSLGTLAGNIVDPQPALYPTFGWAPCNSGSSNTANGNNCAPKTLSGAPPDWDSGCTTGSDGPWINKADEGSGPYGGMPYYGNPVNQPACLFTANREVCSPGMLGSLPTGVDSTGNKPVGWQTLLFRPGPGAAGYGPLGMTHPGEGVPTVAGVYSPPYTSPPDHLWMDLFWIPVTEPYAISEPMSTAGKINLNYQILPFTYIKRATALRAAMATEKIAQVGLPQSATCKGNSYQEGVVLYNGATGTGILGNGILNVYGVLGQVVNARYPIDLDVTLSQFDKKFNNWDVFRSASQICEEFLVPMDIPNLLQNGTASASTTGPIGQIVTPSGNYALPTSLGDTTGATNFAKDWYIPVTTPQKLPYINAPFAMIGDNLREQPYAHLYGKLTTKSNTFTVYYRVQSLKKPASVAAGVWNENLGAITGEFRGSTTIERFIDPNEKTGGVNVVPDAVVQVASGSAPTSLEAYYKWRVVENHQFAP